MASMVKFNPRLNLIEMLFSNKFITLNRWEKQHTDLRVPSYSQPNRNVNSKIASFDNTGYKTRIINWIILFDFNFQHIMFISPIVKMADR